MSRFNEPEQSILFWPSLPFAVEKGMSDLLAPLCIIEKDDGVFDFFFSTDDMVNDRFDYLWGGAYEGWDSLGQHFFLRRRPLAARWWHRLLNTDDTFLAIEEIGSDPDPAASIARLRSFLEADGNVAWRTKVASAQNMAELISLGIELEKDG